MTLVAAASSRTTTGKAAIPVPTLPAPADFAGRIDNKFFPLNPGIVTHKTKLIAGIRATVVLDQVFVAGKPEEKTFDWYAQDKRGNVW